MGIEGYVSVCVQLYCVGFHCLSLHVLAECYHMGKKRQKKQRSRILQAYGNKISYANEDGHVVKDSENQHNKAAHRWKQPAISIEQYSAAGC
jgi:hypothetical protein